MTLSECNEVQRRRLAGIKAIEMGRGGILYVCKLTGMSHHTVIKGMKEVRNTKKPQTIRLRKEGGGRKKIIDKNPNVKKEIEDGGTGINTLKKTASRMGEDMEHAGKNIYSELSKNEDFKAAEKNIKSHAKTAIKNAKTAIDKNVSKKTQKEWVYKIHSEKISLYILLNF